MTSISISAPQTGCSSCAPSENENHLNNYSSLEKKLLFCALFTAPLFLHMLFPHSFLHYPWVQFALCFPVFIVSLSYFGKSAISSLRSGLPNMDVLIIMGVISAFTYSTIGLVLNLGADYLFFETAATVTTLVLLGNVIEHRAVTRTTSAVNDLAKLQPLRARRVISKEHTTGVEDVPLEEVRVGDLLIVNSGDKVPTDGEIIWGEGSFDEAMITGESAPAFKSAKDQVIGGTLLADGSVKIKATAVSDSTVLAHIIGLVNAAQASRPNIQKIGDKVSGIFVPVVLLIAIGTFFGWLLFGPNMQTAIMSALAVVVISCPCAMGLATPTAVMVGLGRAAKSGVLIKGGETSELLSKVTSVIFDKTGTLTTGDLKVEKFTVLDGDASKLKSVLKSMESHSNHPYARAIVKAFSDSVETPLNSTEEIPNLGVRAVDGNNDKYQASSWRGVKHLTEDLSHSIYLTKNDRLVAWLDLADEIADGSLEAINELKKMKLTPVMLSGDRATKCEALAKTLGISIVYSEKTPGEKLEIVNQLKKEGRVAYIGDGINDGPALAAADVGISFSSASDVSKNSAQVVLLKHDLNKLIEAIHLATATYRTIVQNLFWAFCYNIIAIPFAAMGGLSPIVGALTMACSDVVIIGNSLLLKFKKI
jgi:Cu+-exporting ATPase